MFYTNYIKNKHRLETYMSLFKKLLGGAIGYNVYNNHQPPT